MLFLSKSPFECLLHGAHFGWVGTTDGNSQYCRLGRTRRTTGGAGLRIGGAMSFLLDISRVRKTKEPSPGHCCQQEQACQWSLSGEANRPWSVTTKLEKVINVKALFIDFGNFQFCAF